MDLNSKAALDDHVQGRNHQRLVLAQKYEGSLYCELCRYTANGPLQFDVHIKSKSHRSLSGESTIQCDICNITSSSEASHELHIKVKDA